MKILQPVQRILNEVATYFVAIRAVEVDGCTPRCLVVVGEIGSELAQVIALWAEVVVDDIERHGQASRVCGINESLQITRRSIRVVDSVGINAVIAPIAMAWKLRDGH